MAERIAVVGLGYVGLPLALAFARKFPDVIGFDINQGRVDALRAGHDVTRETTAEELGRSTLQFTADPEVLKQATFYIVAVPTPVDGSRRPDLTPVVGASRLVGKALSPGDVVVYESTVYPGVTEEVCAPILAGESGLRWPEDFHLGYSPERINPGDKEHTIERIIKIVAGDNPAVLERIARTYEAIVEAGVYRAPSIKVAEAAKVIENTQRDVNIALVNELAIIFDRVGIATKDVLAAAGTKWNFLNFRPGLVGGHCIGVDPYYLTHKAEELGYHPQMILAGRRINDGMGQYVAQRCIKMLIQGGCNVNTARIGILGLTFKEDVPDLRNSKVFDIIAELREYGVQALGHDPVADREELDGLRAKWDIVDEDGLQALDGIVLAVSHRAFLDRGAAHIAGFVKPGGVVLDIKGLFSRDDFPNHAYWCL